MSFAPDASRAKALIIDANILVRAVLGRRVLSILETHARLVRFLTPEVAFADARAYLPEILTKRGLSPDAVAQLVGLEVLERLPNLVTPVPYEVYAGQETEARRRLRVRDESDWPFVALALAFSCPIWTEDQDFFGSGVPTWTTDRVEIYLRD